MAVTEPTMHPRTYPHDPYYSYMDASTPASHHHAGSYSGGYYEPYPPPRDYHSMPHSSYAYRSEGKGYRSPIRGERQGVEDHAILTYHENDVLMGRGGKNNAHSGNEKLRQFARKQCAKYRISTKKGKSQISRDLVIKMRALNPPARFLKRDSDTGTWVDVGDDIAREKASQVLRDAVALLQDGSLLEEDVASPTQSFDDGSTEPTTTAKSDRRKSSDSNDMTPGLMEPIRSSSSYPPPTPIESSRKRQRDPYGSDEPLIYEPSEFDSPSRRRRSEEYAAETRELPPNWQHGPPSFHRGYYPSYDSDSRYKDYGPAKDASFMPPPPSVQSSGRYAESPRSRTVQHPGSYMNPSPQRKHSHSGRPQIVSSGARQASTASCQSLLGDVNAGVGGDFDLFGGELVCTNTNQETPKKNAV